MHQEGIEIVRPTLESLVAADYPKENLILVLATEERAGKLSQETAKGIEKEFAGKFFKFLVTCHPQNIPESVPPDILLKYRIFEFQKKLNDQYCAL